MLAACLSLLGCAATPPAQPLDRSAITQKILSKDPNSTDFRHHLIQHGYVESDLPFKSWDLDKLTLVALFFNTNLDVAKKQLALANFGVTTAGVRNSPSVNADIGRSNQKNGDIRPWSYGLSVAIPIQTTNKRQFKVEKATQYAEAARMDVAEAAWQLRNQIAVRLMAYHQNRAETELLIEKLATQSRIVTMIEKRVVAGMASNATLSRAQLTSLEIENALHKKRTEFSLIQAKLAGDLGLTPQKLTTMTIQPLALDTRLAAQKKSLSEISNTLQAEALLNRIDIRRSLAEYAAAEANIKLQAAKQMPDLVLSPSMIFDFGDSIWSLGFSSLINSLDKNKALMNEAKLLREVQGAHFEKLQANTITHLSQAQISYNAAQEALAQATQQQAKQKIQLEKIQTQFNAGLINQVELQKFMLNNIVVKQQLLAAKFQLLQNAYAIENVMQKPLFTSFNLPQINDKSPL